MAFPVGSNWYRSTIQALFDRVTAGPDIGDTWKVGLATNSVGTNNFDTTTGYDWAAAPWSTGGVEVSASGTNYTTGGNAVTLSTFVGSSSGGSAFKINALAATQWTSATFTAYGAVVYDANVSNTVKYALCTVDFGGPQSPSAGTLTINWNSGTPFTIFTIS
jgi:hypothetical protein